MWQGDIGADFPNLFAGNGFAGTLSADSIGGYAAERGEPQQLHRHLRAS